MNKARTLAVAIALATGAAGTLGVSAAHAADKYPSKAIRVIVPFAGRFHRHHRAPRDAAHEPGTGSAHGRGKQGGAGGAIGASEAARAEPDGYTLSIATVSTMAVNPACRPNDLPYDPIKDFQPVTNFANTANVVAVNPKFPAKDFKGFLEELKKNRQVFLRQLGTCGVLHLMGESFKMATGTDIVHVPYKARLPAVADAVGGQIEIIFDNLPSSMPQIQAGKLRAMAIAWPGNIDAIRTCRPSRTPASRC